MLSFQLKTHELECRNRDVVPDGVAGISKKLEDQLMIMETNMEGMRKEISHCVIFSAEDPNVVTEMLCLMEWLAYLKNLKTS